MENQEFVKKQFEIFKKRGANYRNVLILTSFIETIIRENASKGKKLKEFKQSLVILGLDIDPKDEKVVSYRKNSQHTNDCLIEINLLRVQRNELLHDILKEKHPKEYIDKTIKEMARNLRSVCTSSNLIRDYFSKNTDYNFDPAKILATETGQ
ncbi:MAG TPA: hypothetical protein VFE94_04065 [Candidatus Paceibacterota bacterium]|nr:hypothetical protein [Candidatus Paceibacterota bacterium]